MAAIAVVVDGGSEGQGARGTQARVDKGTRVRARPARAKGQGRTRVRGQGQLWTWQTTRASNKSRRQTTGG